jgi:hypothetical protein
MWLPEAKMLIAIVLYLLCFLSSAKVGFYSALILLWILTATVLRVRAVTLHVNALLSHHVHFVFCSSLCESAEFFLLASRSQRCMMC